MLEFTILKEPDTPYGRHRENEPVKRGRPRQADILWKGLLEDIFDDFLRFLIPDAEERFDLNKGFEFLSQELDQLFPPEGDEYRPKVIDKLVKVFNSNGSEEWILVHLEIQDNYSRDFNERMFRYFIRIYDKFRKPITAYAILTEATAKLRNNNYILSHLGTELTYKFNVYKIAEQNEEKLRSSNNPFALAVLIAKTVLAGKRIKKEKRDAFLLEVKLKLAKELLAKNIDKNKIRILIGFLKYHVRFRDKENNIIFEQEVQELTGRSTTMGLEELLLDIAKHEGKNEGLEIGEHNKAIEIAREMKKDKFPVATIAKLTKLSIEEIEQL